MSNPTTAVSMSGERPPTAAPASAPRPVARRNRAREWATRAPLLPALIFLIVVTQLPFVATLVISLFDCNSFRPDRRAFPHKMGQRPSNGVHRAAPSCSASNLRISASSFFDAFRAASAPITNFAALPANARSSRSPASCCCVHAGGLDAR